MNSVIKHLKEKFLAGLFIVIPIGITIFIVKFLFNFADGILGSHLDNLLAMNGRSGGHIPGIGMISCSMIRPAP